MLVVKLTTINNLTKYAIIQYFNLSTDIFFASIKHVKQQLIVSIKSLCYFVQVIDVCFFKRCIMNL